METPMTIWQYIELNEKYHITDDWFQNGGLTLWYDLCRQNNLVEDVEENDFYYEDSYSIPAAIRLLDWTSKAAFQKFQEIKGWNIKNPQVKITHQEADWTEGEMHC